MHLGNHPTSITPKNESMRTIEIDRRAEVGLRMDSVSGDDADAELRKELEANDVDCRDKDGDKSPVCGDVVDAELRQDSDNANEWELEVSSVVGSVTGDDKTSNSGDDSRGWQLSSSCVSSCDVMWEESGIGLYAYQSHVKMKGMQSWDRETIELVKETQSGTSGASSILGPARANSSIAKMKCSDENMQE